MSKTTTPPPADSPAGKLHIALGGPPAASNQDRLAAIWSLRSRLLAEEDQIAFSMRLSGSSWEEIGTAFHMSRQAAHQRFGQSAVLLDKLKTASGGNVDD